MVLTVVVETLCFVVVAMVVVEAAWYDVAVFSIVGVLTKLLFLGYRQNMFSWSLSRLYLQNACFHSRRKTVPADLVENIVFAPENM